MSDDSAYGPQKPNNFVEEMKSRRAALGISQTEMARLLTGHPSNVEGISFYQATIQRIESGDRPVKLFEALWIADILQTELLQMVEGYGLSFAHEDLVDLVRADTLDWLVRSAEATAETIRRAAENIDAHINSYRYSVEQTPGAGDDRELLAVADDVETLYRQLHERATDFADRARTASDRCAALPRRYARSYNPDGPSTWLAEGHRSSDDDVES